MTADWLISTTAVVETLGGALLGPDYRQVADS